MKHHLTLAVLASLAVTAPLHAQYASPHGFIEGLGGIVLPTFDIAHGTKAGTAFGVAAGYRVGPRLVLMAEFDQGKLKDKATASLGTTTQHYIAKVGYSLTGSPEHGWEAVVNLGAGAVRFDPDGVANTHTYFAINAGAKLAYNVTRSFALVISPQGDIAFGKKSEIATTNAWVWPLTAGLRLRF